MTAEQIAALARTLPRAEEAWVHERRKFRVRGIVFLSISPDETVLGFGFPKLERDALVASEPAKFLLPRESDLRFNWVCARLAALDLAEMRELVLDAWQMVVPKKVIREYWEHRNLLAAADTVDPTESTGPDVGAPPAST
ncbi:MmcQ/YjbR family DNA-binding protein [Nakamurella lactea]|uniref:MmcQ/YjbR family DNA-binding protein n=1 Tax=Nakamurella lactea TaxID=459515 RepID=UPI001B7FB7FE|nr:MmcQ/YjbR family DNA-binding protein [Nakamurella lactea]